ncbi:ABC transporter ATP-binding protein [Gilvimarinus chinensis]|uniref:ABC transporter ATP-binding protein n=1 Tax=Gilvimarinus chinensis TaxID=396005 RepID=UPI0003725FE7|nr:ABC transporter ATP-binding protein [Gilvimarinus chinensis]
MLSLNRVSFSYRPHENQIDELSLQVAAGEVLGLLGPNGAGKSTLAALVTGQLTPSHGEVLLDNAQIQLGKSDIALVPQEYAFYPRLTVRENLSYFAGLLPLDRHTIRARIHQSLEQTGLSEVAKTRAEKLSGGYKRRLNFAIALLQQPKLLILDEPTANVDPKSRLDILAAVRAQSHSGCAIIYTSHLLDEVEAIANRVAVMHQGKILLQGDTHTLLTEAASQVRFSSAVAIDSSLCQRLSLSQVSANAYRCDLDKAQLTLPGLIKALDHAGVSLTTLNIGQRRLEEVYLQCLARTEVKP